MTNLEKIRAMSVEELAEFIVDITDTCKEEDCRHCPIGIIPCKVVDVENWLESEVEE